MGPAAGGPSLCMAHELLKTGKRGCLGDSAIKKLAGGEIPEPGLSLFLGHVADCPECADRLELQMRGVTFAEPGPVEAGDDAPVEFLEQEAPPAAGELPPGPPLREGDLGSIGRYGVEGLIGRGLSAVTWAAFEPELGRHVAIKMLRPAFAADPEVRADFLMEARAMAAIHHEGIVPVLTVDEAAGIPFLVMPLLRGESLQDRLARGPLGADLARRFTLQVCSALAAAHASGLVHRDVKPSNIWIRREGEGTESAMLLDFGIAVPSETGGSRSGTAGYRSPEQSLGEACDSRSDYFALGCVVYEMLTGRKAWPVGAAGADLAQPLADPAVPAGWKPLLRSLFCLDPSGRPASPAEIARLVPGHNRWLGMPAAVGLMLVLMVAFGVAWVSMWKPGPRPGAPYEVEPAPVAVTNPPAAPVAVTNPPAAPAQAGLKAFAVFQGQRGCRPALSLDGKAVALATQVSRVRLVSVANGAPLLEFDAGGPVGPMALGAAFHAVFRAKESLGVGIFDAQSGKFLESFQVDQKTPVAWAGAANDKLVFAYSGKLCCARQEAPGGAWKKTSLSSPSTNGVSAKVEEISVLRGTDLVGVHYSDRTLCVVNIKENKRVFILGHASTDDLPGRIVDWRNPECCVVVGNRKVLEFFISGKEKGQNAMWQLPAPALGFAWMGPETFAAATDSGGMVPKLWLGKRGSRTPLAELDTGGAWIERLQWIESAHMLAAFGIDGSVRLYQ